MLHQHFRQLPVGASFEFIGRTHWGQPHPGPFVRSSRNTYRRLRDNMGFIIVDLDSPVKRVPYSRNTDAMRQ